MPTPKSGIKKQAELRQAAAAAFGVALAQAARKLAHEHEEGNVYGYLISEICGICREERDFLSRETIL